MFLIAKNLMKLQLVLPLMRVNKEIVTKKTEHSKKIAKFIAEKSDSKIHLN